MIPKIIHFCWLSRDEYPDKIKMCLESWKKKLPDYEIKLWNAQNFDVNCSNWTRNAFEKKQYAFVSDYVRFFALYNYGGIYLDSDIEVKKSFDDLLDKKFFFGYEYEGLPEAAVVGAEKGLDWIKQCLDWYPNHEFVKENGTLNRVVAPLIMQYGFEKDTNFSLIDDGEIKNVFGGTIYPYDYFSSKDSFTGEIIDTQNTYSVHHFNCGWLKTKGITVVKKKIHKLLIHIFGKLNYNKILYKIRKKKFSGVN